MLSIFFESSPKSHLEVIISSSGLFFLHAIAFIKTICTYY